jgi:hypothetical protein
VHDRPVVDATAWLLNSEIDVEQESEWLRPDAARMRLRMKVLRKDDRRLSEARELLPQSQKAADLSSDLGELIELPVYRVDHRWPPGFRLGDWRMLQFDIRRTISHLLLVIIVIDVHHLLSGSCHLTSPNFIRLTT